MSYLCLDDEEALNSIMKDLAALGRCYTQQQPRSRTLLYKQVGGSFVTIIDRSVGKCLLMATDRRTRNKFELAFKSVRKKNKL